jgi:hypothetical protein
MQRSKLFLGVTAILAVACETPTAPSVRAPNASVRSGFDDAPTSQTTFSGEATVVRATVTGFPEITLVGTGPLDASGGALNNTLAKLKIDKMQTGGLLGLDATVGHASTIGQGKRSRSQATVADLAIEVLGQSIEAKFLEAEASAVCDAAGNAVGTARSAIADLMVAGIPISVTGEPGQRVEVAGLTIVLNEQDVKQSGNTADVTVKALHVTAVQPITGTTVDVIVAQAHADIRCGVCTDQGDDFTTGGGWIVTQTSGRADFAIAGGKRPGWGHLTYHDKGKKLTVKSEAVDYYHHDYATNTSTISGWATVNDVPNQRFKVTVRDIGEPGRGSDRFEIELPGYAGYAAANELSGGNIQFHDKPSGCPGN